MIRERYGPDKDMMIRLGGSWVLGSLPSLLLPGESSWHLDEGRKEPVGMRLTSPVNHSSLRSSYPYRSEASRR